MPGPPRKMDAPDEPRADDAPAARASEQQLFRPQAVEDAARARDEGALLRLSPRWTRGVYRALLLMLLAALLFGVFGHVREYAAGSALVLIQDATRVTARAAGNVESVEIGPGDRVELGQVLVRFHAEDERAFLSHLKTRFENDLIQYLMAPEEVALRARLADTRSQIELAENRLAEKTLRAPSAGWVRDVRIQPGQRLESGAPVLTLAERDERHRVVAFVPGQYLPVLEVGQRIRLELHGFQHAHVDLAVTQVHEEAVGPRAALTYVGPEFADALQLTGSNAVVTATLPSNTFFADGREYDYFTGMLGTAEIQVREKPILVALIPGLDGLIERWRR